eukprot:s1045_g5.t1
MAGLLRGRPYTFMREANRQAAGTNGSDGFGKLRFRRGTDGKTRQMLEDVREKRALDLKVEPIHGDIYTYWAFRDVLVHMKHVSEEATHSKVLHVGLICVMIVQILGPPAVLIWSLYAIDWSNARVGLGAWEYIPGSYHKGVSNFFSHLLSTLFLFVFILNGIYVIRDDKQKSEKIWYLVSVLEKDGSGVVNRTWLRVGAFINSWVVVISAICMGPCFMLSKSPKDIIFDAFALLFLFRLDDVNGDLGFLEEQWDSEKFGKLYEDVRSWEEKDQRAGSLESGQAVGRIPAQFGANSANGANDAIGASRRNWRKRRKLAQFGAIGAFQRIPSQSAHSSAFGAFQRIRRIPAHSAQSSAWPATATEPARTANLDLPSSMGKVEASAVVKNCYKPMCVSKIVHKGQRHAPGNEAWSTTSDAAVWLHVQETRTPELQDTPMGAARSTRVSTPYRWMTVMMSEVKREVKAMLSKLDPDGPRLIANLGEGLNGKESPELVQAFVTAVHEALKSPSRTQ